MTRTDTCKPSTPNIPLGLLLVSRPAHDERTRSPAELTEGMEREADRAAQLCVMRQLPRILGFPDLTRIVGDATLHVVARESTSSCVLE